MSYPNRRGFLGGLAALIGMGAARKLKASEEPPAVEAEPEVTGAVRIPPFTLREKA